MGLAYVFDNRRLLHPLFNNNEARAVLSLHSERNAECRKSTYHHQRSSVPYLDDLRTEGIHQTTLQVETIKMDCILTWVLFCAAIATVFAPAPPKGLHNLQLYANIFLVIVAVVRVALDFRKPR